MWYLWRSQLLSGVFGVVCVCEVGGGAVRGSAGPFRGGGCQKCFADLLRGGGGGRENK